MFWSFQSLSEPLFASKSEGAKRMAKNPLGPGYVPQSQKAQGPTNAYGVTPRHADNFIDALQMAHSDLAFHSNGGNNESGVSFSRPGLLNGNRWGYRQVYEGPSKTARDQAGTISFEGGDTLHLHTKDGVANASPEDIVRLHKRVMQYGDDNTVSGTDNHGNIAVFGRPDTLRKRGFTDDQFMDYENEAGVREQLRKEKIGPGYIPFRKIVVPYR